jgi:hypothetical protein
MSVDERKMLSATSESKNQRAALQVWRRPSVRRLDLAEAEAGFVVAIPDGALPKDKGS